MPNYTKPSIVVFRPASDHTGPVPYRSRRVGDYGMERVQCGPMRLIVIPQIQFNPVLTLQSSSLSILT